MSKMKVLICLLVLVTVVASIHAHPVISILTTVGKNNPECIFGNGSCKTLEYVQQQLVAEGVFELISINIRYAELPGIVFFQNICNLTIIGGTILCSRGGGGFVFNNVTNLNMTDLRVNRCGERLDNHSVVLRIESCMNVHMSNVRFSRWRETAITFENTFGLISLVNVQFRGRNELFGTPNHFFSYSGGVELILAENDNSSVYNFSGCIFELNRTPEHFRSYDSTLAPGFDWRGQNLGGAMSIYLQGNSSGNQIHIQECIFKQNNARWGGALHMLLQNNVHDSSITVLNSTFESNTAPFSGAGACIRYLREESNDASSNNRITFENCTFDSNSGNSGGGVSIFSVHSAYPPNSSVTFVDSRWLKNSALFGSVVMVAPSISDSLNKGHLLPSEFRNCSFTDNIISQPRLRNGARNSTAIYFYTHAGAFSIVESKVYFSERTIFTNNNGSALHVLSGQIIFKEGSTVTFANNTGIRGASIAMRGLASFLLNRNSAFLFSHNHAEEIGGGIYYHSFNQLEYTTGRNCFMRLENSQRVFPMKPNNLTIIFEKNTANFTGTSIYASTFYPCYFSTQSRRDSTNFVNYSVLNFLGNITFDDDSEHALATFGRSFNLDHLKRTYRIIPGELINIQMNFLDEFGHRAPNLSAYALNSKSTSSVRVDRNYTLDGNFRLLGKPEENATLQFSQELSRRLTVNVETSLQLCPPGYYFDNKTNTCECSRKSTETYYFGVVSCNNFTSYLNRDYWIGYIPETNYSPAHLYTAVCPLSFCKRETDSSYVKELPRSPNDLGARVCALNRRGILCGRCKDGFTPFYHSEDFRCGSNALCPGGIFLYILSELVPTVIFFTVIITLDFSFTSGGINGFILFSQILSSLTGSIQSRNVHFQRILAVSRVFYDMFNMDYFSTSALSFCLWKDAAVIDLLAFRYITLGFAFGLVVSLILIMNRIKCSRIEEKLNIKNRVSVINGLSAFLIICYAECAQISFYLLTPVQLKTQGGVNGELVTFFGGMKFFEGRHLFYVIVAILIIATVVSIPPLLLLIYPTLLHLLALCRLSEHWMVSKLLSILQIYKLKPLIDSFQGCYKDRLRFFAGLYFVYRVAILACHSIAHSLSQFYVLSQFLLLAFMGIHSIVQPYKKRLHNILDSFVFLNLITINGCTIFIDVYTVDYRENYFDGSGFIIRLVGSVRVILVCLPMLCFIFWIVVKCMMLMECCQVRLHKLREKLCNNMSTSNREYVLDSLDYHQLETTNQLNLGIMENYDTQPTY